MVTGATGYVAGRLIEKLLNDGLTVHAAVRNPDKKEKLIYLDAISEKSKGSIKYYKADLLTPGSYEEAMQECELVFHTASPFTISVKDPQKDLVDPAVKGTANVLESANKIQSVKRVVLTSSCASIYGDNKDILSYPNKIMTEKQWNTTSTLKRLPYSYSKVEAEKKAWEINKRQTRWDLVVINPSFVLGPGINPYGTSESYNIMKQYGDGTMKMGAPRFGMGCVDVRDVANAHFKAGFTPEAKGRYIASSESLNFFSMAQLLHEKYGKDYPLPKRALPKWFVWLIAPAAGMTRQNVRDNVNIDCPADNSKSKRELGMTYIPIKRSINEFFQQLIDYKILKP
jgi:dihydroflavonol-4-reductase